MDNRRVMKAYRDRSGQRSTSGGLFSRVKRYFSGPHIMQPPAVSAAASPSATQVSQRNITASVSTPLKSATALTDLSRSLLSSQIKRLSTDEDPNRILSAFFQEKKGQPLTEVEYEGVITLLERSKASITLPLPQSSPSKPKTVGSGADFNTTSNSQVNSTVLPNHKIGPYSQKKLRNTSMHSNNSSFAASDYKPAYRTFNESSRSATLMKRVYQFSGLPSPYRTRIKAPNFAARKVKRIAPLVPNKDTTWDAPTTTSTPAAAEGLLLSEQQAFQPKSKTANALLSVLDGETKTDDKSEHERDQAACKSATAFMPLHNPYFRPKRRRIPYSSASLTASDITNTVLHNNAEALAEPSSHAKSAPSLFENIGNCNADASEDGFLNADKDTQIKDKDIQNDTEPKKAFSFGAKVAADFAGDRASKFSFSPSSEVSRPEAIQSGFTFTKPGVRNPEINSEGANFGEAMIASTIESNGESNKFGFLSSKVLPADTQQALFSFSMKPTERAVPVEAEKSTTFGFGPVKSEDTKPQSSEAPSTSLFGTPAESATTSLYGNSQTQSSFLIGQKGSICTKPERSSFASVKNQAQVESTSGENDKGEHDNVKDSTKTHMLQRLNLFSYSTPENNTFNFGKAMIKAATSSGEPVPVPAKVQNWTSNPFTFGAANGSSVTNGNGAKEVKGDVSEFAFPEIVNTPAPLSNENVKKYEALFKF